MKKTIKPARAIRAHKGGRTMQLHGRFTPDEAALIWKVLERRGMTFSDWVTESATTGGADAGAERLAKAILARIALMPKPDLYNCHAAIIDIKQMCKSPST